MREIEIKLKVNNLKDVEEGLNERGCVLSAPVFQRDVVYSKKGSVSEWESPKEGDITIRIRYLESAAELNCKQQRSMEMDSIEYETEIKDPKAMHSILFTLGYRPEVEVKKMRRKGKIENYEICLDEVEHLGSFVELEMLTHDDANPEEAREELFKVLESLGLSRDSEETRGYDTQMYQLFHT